MTVAAIREFLRLPDCVIFVGSGISLWSGLPTWKQLLLDLAQHIEAEGQSAALVHREIANGDFLQAASYGVSKLTPASFGAFIRKATQFGSAEPHAIHKAIVELGPTSFITTNYDTLIEQALSVWRKETFFPHPVTNRHLVELAEILSARSSHFVFKPHGDANDVTSVVLTREQYRLLLPGGERHNALEALKTLLVTRPVLYLGFGLRDPDFIYLRDLLLNIYQGSVRDHWAIMPDVSHDEAIYWRTQYGIKLHGYSTHENPDGSRDHRALLSLLQELAAPEIDVPASTDEPMPVAPGEAERVLALTRYASGVVRRFALATDPVEVRISPIGESTSAQWRYDPFDGSTTTRFLTQGPERAYLLGAPGAGKTFALRLATRELAVRLQEACIDDQLTSTALTLPVFIDLKLYQGDLRAQIEAEIPAGFTLNQLRGDLRLKLYFDAFNEMPSEHLESGSLFSSLDTLEAEIGSFEFAIASRTTDGLTKRAKEDTFYEINRFPLPHVDRVLAQRGINLSGEFADGIRTLLSRPFFLHLVSTKLVDLPKDARPRDLYHSFFIKLQEQFSRRYRGLELLPALTKVAFRVIDADSEAFPLAWLTDVLASQMPENADFSLADIINWLVAKQVLIPYTRHRVSFVHQSITEYCAAIELSHRALTGAVAFREIIASKKWDQCLFLAISLMEPANAEQALDESIFADLRLAVNAVRFAEEGQSAFVSKILEAVVKRATQEKSGLLLISLHSLPVGQEHIELLERLIGFHDSIGGDAVCCLAQLKGQSFKQALFDLLEEHADDFNFSVNGIARALRPMLDHADLPRLIHIANIWQSKGDGDSCSAITAILAHYEPQKILSALSITVETMPPRTASLLADALHERDDYDSFCLQADLLRLYPEATTSAFALSISGHELTEQKLSCLNTRHVEAIWSARFSESLWFSALSDLCGARPDLAMHVKQMAEAHNGIEAIALLKCAGAENDILFSILEKLLEQDNKSLESEPFEFFNLREHFDWRGRENLLARSLGRGLPRLTRGLLDENYSAQPLRQGVIDLKALQPVIELACAPTIESENSWLLPYKLGHIVAQIGDKGVQNYCLKAIKDGPPALRFWVTRYYLSAAEHLTSDVLDDDMIAALLSDLNTQGCINHFHNPLGRIATDRFVVERLLPLAEDASEVFRRNLALVLEAAGDRHGKRYLMPAARR